MTWKELMPAESEFVEGYFVRFRDMSGGSQKFNMKTVMRDNSDNNGNGGNSYVISNLRKFTEYEVRIYRVTQQQISNVGWVDLHLGSSPSS